MWLSQDSCTKHSVNPSTHTRESPSSSFAANRSEEPSIDICRTVVPRHIAVSLYRGFLMRLANFLSLTTVYHNVREKLWWTKQTYMKTSTASHNRQKPGQWNSILPSATLSQHARVPRLGLTCTQCVDASAEASRMLRLLRPNLRGRPEELKRLAYFSLVGSRPH